MKKQAVVLLSGGLDSTTALGIAHHAGFEPHMLKYNVQIGEVKGILVGDHAQVTQTFGK